MHWTKFLKPTLCAMLLGVCGCGGGGSESSSQSAPSPALSTPAFDPSERWLFVPYAFPTGTNETGAIFSPRTSVDSGPWQSFNSGDGVFYAGVTNHRLEFDLYAFIVPELSSLSIQTTVSLPSSQSISSPSNVVQFIRPLFKPNYLMATYYQSVGQVLVQAGNPSKKAGQIYLEGSQSDGSGMAQSWVPLLSQPLSGPSNCTFLVDPSPEGQSYIYQAYVAASGTKSSTTTTPPITIAFLPPDQVVATPQIGAIRLDWHNRTNHSTGIQILRRPGYVDNIFSSSPVATLSASSTSFTDYPTDPGYYTYQVVAVDGEQTTGGKRITSRTLETPLLTMQTLSGIEAGNVFRRPTGEFICLVGSLGGGVIHYQVSNGSWVDHPVPGNFQSWCEGGALFDSLGHPHFFYTASSSTSASASRAMHEWLDESGWHSEVAGEEPNYQGAQYQAFIDSSDSFYLLSTNRGGTSAVSYYFAHGRPGNWSSSIISSPGGYPDYSNSTPVACVAPNGKLRIGIQSLVHSWLITRSTDGSIAELQIPDAPTDPNSDRSRKILGMIEGSNGVIHFLLGSTSVRTQPTVYSTHSPALGWSSEEAVGGFIQEPYVLFPLRLSPSGSRLLWQVNTNSGSYLAIRDSGAWKLTHLGDGNRGMGFLGEKVWIVNNIPSWYPDIPESYILLSEP